jgi:hypothetical protein
MSNNNLRGTFTTELHEYDTDISQFLPQIHTDTFPTTSSETSRKNPLAQNMAKAKTALPYPFDEV